MTILLYDHSIEGFFTAVFAVYEFKYAPVEIKKQGFEQSSLLDEIKLVYTDKKKSDRVFNKVKALIGEIGMHYILYTLLTEDEFCERYILDVIKYVIANPTQNVIKDMSHHAVLKLSQYTKMVGREKHRMEAFVRFKLTVDGIYFSEIEPDFNVLPIIAKHFHNRYLDQKWMIYDVKRNYGMYYDLKTLEFVEMKFNHFTQKQEGLEMLARDEDIYQNLWRTYFDRTNIKARRNMRLHIQHVPKRYWKYLTEKMPH